MNSLEEIIAGLTLINSKRPLGQFLTAEHDEIWAGDLNDFTPEETSQMREWGWSTSEYGSFHRFV